jgi:UDP-N-acetylmuramate--alanine ligase
MLAELMRMKPLTVAVAGSHGKTTTTSMVATVLGIAGLDPTFVIGGIVRTYRANARLGKSQLMVVEADESDRSFLMLTPTIAVVTNIDREHMDYYHDMEDVRKCFSDFVNKVPFYGAAVLCLDDPHVQAVIPNVGRRRITYGMSAQADISAHDIRYDQQFGSAFSVLRGVDVLGKITLRVPGKHNVYNSLAAIAVGIELEVPFDTVAHALSEFTGADRRFQFKGEEAGVTVVDDYGHHPTEVKATLSAARIGAPNRRIVVLFQPHRYTRTNDLMDEFASAFNNADVLFVTEIYAASEPPIDGVNAEVLTGRIKSYGHKHAEYIGELENAPAILRQNVREGDLVITLGAGSVHRAGDQLLALLRGESSQGAGS